VKTCILVVPCFNEAARLDDARLARLLDAGPAVSLLFVNDGSTDGTLDRLEAFARRHPARASVFNLRDNLGKAEAVRRGMLAALDRGADLIGYYDADLATPPEDMLEIISHLETEGVEAAIGARVALLGRNIERRASRHYLGRVFATAASAVLGLRVYDTQCGAKVFRAGPALRSALAEPFLSRWVFDVELIGRLDQHPRTAPADAWIVEVPLRAWRDVGASRLRGPDMLRAIADLARVAVDLRRRRRGELAPAPPVKRPE
jgi:glycosyltransferase involved in cell wall biosynthesis